MSRKTYFLVNSYEYSPETHFKLGQIITDLKNPERAICEPLDPPIIHSSKQRDWKSEREKTTGGSVGIWAKFLASILGIGADAIIYVENTDQEDWKFDSLETRFFDLNEAYIKESMNAPAVKSYFERYHRKSAYMITGVKIARDAGVKHRRKRGHGGHASLGFDATGSGALGPEASMNSERVINGSFSKSEAFVFAYQLEKISKDKKTGAFKNEKYVKGAFEIKATSGEDGESLGDFTSKRDSNAQLEDFVRDLIEEDGYLINKHLPAPQKRTVTGKFKGKDHCGASFLKIG